MPDEVCPSARRLHPILVETVLTSCKLYPDRENLPETEQDLVAFALAEADWKPDEREGRIAELLQTLLQLRDPRLAVAVATREYTFTHQGATARVKGRLIFSDGLLRFIASLAEPGGPAEGLTVAELARAGGVPQETLEEWLRSSADA